MRTLGHICVWLWCTVGFVLPAVGVQCSEVHDGGLGLGSSGDV